MSDIRQILSVAPVVPVITIERLEHAVPLARALVAGGLRVLEITLRTPVALAAIETVRGAVPDAIVGAGTLLRAKDFSAATAAGAQFGVSPGLTAGLAEASRSVDFPLLPGVMTPSELMAAAEMGFDTLKLFPAEQAGGTRMLAAVSGPFRGVVFCPTGGVTPQNASTYLALANVVCVGGSWVAPPDLIKQQNWAAIEGLAAEAMSLRRRQPA
jgi:2-dehydro-3-deoxyphosphogluconate aldolase/(4S)-4-hydroxy-2-oxoglutarate aldolase